MISVAPIITTSGKSLQIRALAGEVITFTRFKIGAGELQSGTGENLVDLIDPKFAFGISSIDSSTTGYVGITGSFDNTDITTDFRWRELGVFAVGSKDKSFNGDGSTTKFVLNDKPNLVHMAKVGGSIVSISNYNPTTGEVTLASAPAAGTNNVVIIYADDAEVLYAYSNDGDNAGTLKADISDVTTEQTINIIIAVGDAEHVTAIISASTLYALKSDFDAHVENHSNPHNVTKAQIGLGNVLNVAPNNMTITYNVPTTLANLTSGEGLSAAMGKLARAVSSLISHIGSKSNPHEVSISQVAGEGYTNNNIMVVTFEDNTTATYNFVGKRS